MLFKPALCEKILSGQKTQTRRLVKDGEARPLPEMVTAIAEKWPYRSRLKWRVGQTYAVQPGRGKPGIGRILLKSIRRECLNGITPEGCWAEGIERHGGEPFCNERLNAVSDFSDLWDSINDRPGIRWKDNPDVWVLEFEAVTEATP